MQVGIKNSQKYIGKSLSIILQDLHNQNSLVKLRFNETQSKSMRPYDVSYWMEEMKNKKIEDYLVKSLDYIPSVGEAIDRDSHIETVPYEITIELKK